MKITGTHLSSHITLFTIRSTRSLLSVMRTFSGKQMRPKWTCIISYSKGHDILKRRILPPFHTTFSPRSLPFTTTSPLPARPLNPVLLSIPFPLAPVFPIVDYIVLAIVVSFWCVFFLLVGFFVRLLVSFEPMSLLFSAELSLPKMPNAALAALRAHSGSREALRLLLRPCPRLDHFSFHLGPFHLDLLYLGHLHPGLQRLGRLHLWSSLSGSPVSWWSLSWWSPFWSAPSGSSLSESSASCFLRTCFFRSCFFRPLFFPGL